MPIYHNRQRSEFAQIPNRLLGSPDLSFKAKGILAYLLSKPGDWEANETDIQRHATDGRHAVRSGLHELERAGYIVRWQDRTAGGTFGEWHFDVYDNPVPKEKRTDPEGRTFTKSRTEVGFSDSGFSDIGKPDLNNTDGTNTDGTNTEETYISGSKNEPDVVSQPALEGFSVGEKKEDAVDKRAWFVALASVCRVDLSKASSGFKAGLGKSAKKLREAGVTPEDIEDFGRFWYGRHWLGLKGEAPRPSQVGDNWGHYESWVENGRPVNRKQGSGIEDKSIIGAGEIIL